MSNQKALEQEPYAGADLDTIEVPDEDLIMFNEEKKDEAKQEEAKQEEEQKNPVDEKEEERRLLYKGPRNKLVRKYYEASEERAAAQAKADMLEQERNELLRQLEDARKGSNSGDHETMEQLEAKEQELQQRRKVARENDEPEELVSIMDQLMDLRDQRAALRERQQQEEQRKAQQQQQHQHRDQEQEQTRRQQQEEGGSIHPSARAWLDRNPWFADPKNKHLAKYAQDMEAELRKGGMAIGDDLYEELDQALNELDEYREARGEFDEDPEPKQQSRQPINRPRHILPPSRGDNSDKSRKNGPRLTDYDRQTMKRFGLDPNDEIHKSAYLKRKS